MADLTSLEDKIDELIALSESLVRKQAQLDAERESWQTERASLMERNEAAKAKIEAMIMRLKSLE